MKTLKFIVLCTFLSQSIFLSMANPLWMRYPVISPDGKEIAFTYKGDIYKVAVTGGEAKQITMHEAYDYMPVWSPDSKKIVFASDRYGNFDLFITSSQGGNAQRLTTNSAGEFPYSFTPDGKNVIFSAYIQAPVQSAAFPSRVMSQLYAVSIDGGKPVQILATPAEKCSFSKDGKKMLYQDRKGQEDKFRKHHTSAVTRDIWIYDTQTKKHTQLINNPGEDTDPVFSPDNNRVYFLSERSGTYNVHVFNYNMPDKVEQITSFKTHPVRYLSISENDILCFAYDGEIYIKDKNNKPQKINIEIIQEDKKNNSTFLSNRNAIAVSLSGDAKQMAVLMRGEVFVTSVDYKYTKRITNTPSQEAMAVFSPNGKTIAYASERDGTWNIFTAKTNKENESYFFNSTLIEEEPLFKPSPTERFLPQYSPDGKEIAYIEDRARLMVMNLETKKVRQITDGAFNANSSGMIEFSWSPDSKWFTIVYTPNKHEPYSDIGLVSAQGGEITNLTNSGYIDENPRWVLDGNAILFCSERYGMRNHASWGSLNDVMIAFLNQEAYDKFILSKDDADILKEDEKKNLKKDNEKESGKEEDKKDGDKKNDKAKVKDIIVELKGIEDRTMRLTPNSSDLGDAVLTKDNKLYYTAAFEKTYDLWSVDCRTRDIKLELKNIGRVPLFLDKDHKTLFLMGNAMQKITLAGNKKEPVVCKAEMDLDLAAEREYMFEHIWMQELKRFYVTSMHGVDWDLMKKVYSKFLPHINNNYDFSEMLSEMLGELNTSHTGSRYSPISTNADITANLGLLFSWDYDKDGLLIDEVLEKGPFDNAGSKAGKGCIVEKIDGKEILAGKDFYHLLNKKAGQQTLVSLYNPQTKERWDEVIKPVNDIVINNLLYNRWVKQRAADVERLSNGRLGYVHLQSMGDPSFRSIYADILGKYNNKEGIVIDTRFNGGGRLHEDIEVLFSGKKYFTQMIRGKDVCDMPSRRWNKPSIMVMGEANYSNAHGTPWVYKHTGIGKLVGMPVPGTMTSVSWETLQDPTLLFGIPIVGYKLPDGSYLENQQLEPDFKVANSPEAISSGRDEQLEKAVQELLKEL